MDKETQYICVIKRPHDIYWCGYVILPHHHPWHSKSDNIPVEVHGGLTYYDENGMIGFDYGHLGDDFSVDDELALTTPYTVYRDKEYVKSEVTNLAKQLKELETSK